MRLQAIFPARQPLDPVPGQQLDEAVLYMPAETALAPYVEAAPSPETKQWLATNFKNWLLKSSPADLHKLPYLPPNATPQQQKAFAYNDLYDVRLTPATETMLGHILDFFNAKPELPRLARMSVPDLIKAADEAVRLYNAKVAKRGKGDDPKGVKTLMEFPGGYRVVELTSQPALDREGNLMGHCVGRLHGCYLKDKTRRIFSLRDANNEPHATLEVLADGLHTTEIKGKENAPPVRRYWPMLRQFIEQYRLNVVEDHANIGLLRIRDPETHDETTMTIDQFRDMVLDPNNPRGQAILASYSSHFYHVGADVLIGLFGALYGTDRLTERLIQAVFQTASAHAIQVVQHYGNRFTPDQLATALVAMRPGYQESLSGMYKTMLIATKPDAATCDKILLSIPERNANQFVVALAQVLPDIYRTLLDQPGVLERELAAGDERAAALFFVLLGTDRLTPPMITAAFEHGTDEAMKHLQRSGLRLTPEQVLAAFVGFADRYWSTSALQGIAQTMERLLTYTDPDSALLGAIFRRMTDHAQNHHGRNDQFAHHLLIAVRKLMPERLDRRVQEQAVIAIDRDELYRDYLRDDADPSNALQTTMWRKAYNDGKVEHMSPKYLGYLRRIEPAIFEKILTTLKPDPVPTTRQDYKYVKNQDGSSKQVAYQRKLTDKEQVEARQEARTTASRRFIHLLHGALRAPGKDDEGAPDQAIALDPTVAKFRDGEAAFAALGKSGLFANAVSRINRNMLVNAIDTGDYRNQGNRELFAAHVSAMPAPDIVRVIDRTDASWFGVLVDHAPHRVAEVMATPARAYGRKSHDHYGRFDYPVNKDQAFVALETVWASGRVPQRIKDDFTEKVFKRFKPKPDKLLSMLARADSAVATEYVLRKTKNPAPDLVRFVFEHFPELLAERVALDKIPDDVLTRIFTDQPRVAHALLDRDLRDYGTESRSKWASGSFRKNIDHASPDFQRYQAAAEAAGKGAGFARYVREAELEMLHPQLTGGQGADDEADPETPGRINFTLLRQHLDEYSTRTLVHVAEHDASGEAATLYFQRFAPAKLARLVEAGLLKEHSWSYKLAPKLIAKLDPHKLAATAKHMLASDQERASALISAMLSANTPMDDALIIAALQSKANGMHDLGDQIVKRADLSDTVKHWVADHKPHKIPEIREPTRYVVAKLFDHWGKITKNKHDGKLTVNYWFASAVHKWFQQPDSIWFRYRPNPAVLHMLVAEATKRGGAAVTITRAMVQDLKHLRQKANGDNYVSVDAPTIQALPAGVTPAADD